MPPPACSSILCKVTLSTNTCKHAFKSHCHDDYLGSKSPLGDFFPAGTPARFCKTLKNQWKYSIFEARIAKTHVARGSSPTPPRDPWGLQNSHFSIKNQLNIEVTFACHFEPLYEPTWRQLGPNLASKIHPKPVSRRCENATS